MVYDGAERGLKGRGIRGPSEGTTGSLLDSRTTPHHRRLKYCVGIRELRAADLGVLKSDCGQGCRQCST